MRSKLITAAAVVAGMFLAAPMATADEVQEQLRLMEQRMAEMEDRLQATSEELETAKETVKEQQAVLSDAGLAEEDSRGFRAGVSSFFEQVDVSGVVAASYNHRFSDFGNDQNIGGVANSFRHPDANTFQLDQAWFVIDKPVTEESRGGFHVEYVFGKTAQSQGQNRLGSTNTDYESSGLLYTGYVSYLAPIANGIEINAGKLATPLGAEVLQTNQNFNVTTGAVFLLQPVTHTGVQFSTPLTDELGFIFGVVNDVYTDSNFDTDDDKAYYAQLSYSQDMWGLNVGAIVGNDNLLGCVDADDDCYTSVFDVLFTVDPTEELSMWLNFDWVRAFEGRNRRGGALVAGTPSPNNGDLYGVSGAARYAITEDTGVATRVEYIYADNTFTNVGGGGDGAGELWTLTTTVDHALTDDVKIRIEGRWDHLPDRISPFGSAFANAENGPANGLGAGVGATSSRKNQFVGLAELYYEF